MQRNDLLCWMDLEMTSLEDARKDSIIELAMVLTDAELNVVAEGPDLAIHADQETFDALPANMRAFHEATGIIPLAVASPVTEPEAEQQALDFLKEHCAPQSAPLCGNSIFTDRHSLRLRMPALNDYLFYRSIDVSTLKELAKRWVPAIYEEAKKRKGESAHRAKDDIMKSIEELRFYRGAFFAQTGQR
ncbi:MAG: oligoribonuclease [Minisyncoccia bacterium]